jgi:hypothetical protein
VIIRLQVALGQRNIVLSESGLVKSLFIGGVQCGCKGRSCSALKGLKAGGYAGLLAGALSADGLGACVNSVAQ